jgi:uncharacterized repeat protein (TIGR01451 family)
MKRILAISAMALLTACLIGWAALAGAPPADRLPSADDLSAEPNSSGSGRGAAPPGEMPLRPRSSNSPTSLPGTTPSTPISADPYPGTSILPPSGSPSPKAPTPGAAMEQLPAGPAGYPNMPNQPPVPSGSQLPMEGQIQGPAGYGAGPGTAPQPLGNIPGGTTLPPLGGSTEPSGQPADPNEERVLQSPLAAEDMGNHQEPAVSLQWIGPTAAKVNQPNVYSLVVRNICTIPVQQVMVRVRIPANLSCGDTEPKAVAEGNVLVWELGALQPKEEKVLRLKLLAERKGDASPQAWVTFTGSAVLHIKVREPKLALKAQGPSKLLLGETAAFQLEVTNPGDGSADQVKIHANLSEGLECPRGNKIDFDIGNLAAGETRTVTVMCIAKKGGTQKCEVAAEADGGLRAQEAAQVSVTMPRLELQLAGPGLRYLGRKALYTLKVCNPGDAPATNVTLSDVVPEGFKVLAASDGGRHDFSAHTVSWFLGDIKPGEAREVKLEVQAVNPGEFKHKVSAVGAHNLSAESELATRIEGLSALMLEMVDTEDPIEVNSETSYEVRISNTGSKVETNIKLAATIPDKMEFKSATGPVRFHEEGKLIVFEPIEKLAPRADAVFRINVKATDQGIVRFKIQMTSTNLTEPVIKMEATRIYSDAPETKSSH